MQQNTPFGIEAYPILNAHAHLYASHIPQTPPIILPSNEIRENEWTPNSEGAYPPAMEPTVIPIIIIVFLDNVF